MTKKNKKGPKRVKPDDYFTWGPFELARFGKTTIMKSHLTAEQLAEAQARMAERFPTLVAELDALVASIASQIARLPPTVLLHRAWWEFATVNLGIGGTNSDDSEQLTAMRMIDYVQSVLASVKPKTYAENVSEEDWKRLKADVSDLFTRLTVEYQTCLTGYRKVQDSGLDMELEEFRMRTEGLWINIRGKRYHVHERQALFEILAPHSDVLLRLFGIDSVTFVNELAKILAKLTRGLADSMQELNKFRDDTLNRLEAVAGEHLGLSFEALRDKVFEDKDLAERREKVGGQLFGMDLFDVAKNTALPETLLDALTWSPGEDTDFFAPGEFSGWPLRIWPVMKRPFIRLDGRIFCFDMFSLFDNIYRVLRRVILQHEPAYGVTWNERQNAVSEELPFTYLSGLLAGARIYRPVYYRWSVDGRAAQWHEADGLVIFDDHLIVVEVKAGAFTYTSPANDLAAHLESLRNLLQAPARQGSRFIDYLESAPEVPIADEGHNEIGRLRRSDFRHITVCAVTLDVFGALAARAQHLAPLGIGVGRRAVWPLSIDDLRVYSELFDNPLIFLHFVEQRMRAGKSKHLDLNDEMDHLGLYVAQNNYSQYAAELKGNELDRLSFDGFRTPIDEYYGAIVRGDTPKLVRQDMPPRLAEIISLLAGASESRRSELASFLLDAAGDFRNTLTTAIDQALRENKELGRARPLSFYGPMAMTLYIWSPAAPRLEQQAKGHARVVMAAGDEASRRLVELEYSDAGTLIGAHLTHVSLVAAPLAEVERIKAASVTLKTQRVRLAQAKGKIGRNEPCPCGNGKKFKHCHGQPGQV
jgi:preprotein translocase subunit SecA